MNAIIRSFRHAIVAIAMLLTVASVAAPSLAKRPPDNFYGIVRHVSTANIKVYDPITKQTLGFALTPKFKNVFGTGNTTTQMSAIKAGQYVRVVYDRHFLGLPHADSIYMLNNAEQKLGKQ